MHLTVNDKKVLSFLIKDARISDSEIGRKIGLTPQAIVKIRRKLENAGIIEGYKLKINYKKMGVNLLVMVVLNILPETWHKFSEPEITKKFIEHPYVIWATKIPESRASHILLYGFKDIEQMDRHFIRMKTKLADLMEITQIYPFSVDQIFKDSPEQLFKIIMEDKEFHTETHFRKKG